MIKLKYNIIFIKHKIVIITTILYNNMIITIIYVIIL